PPRVQHQFIPFDHPKWTTKFIKTWKPDFGLIMESELWPNLIHDAYCQNVRLAIVNGRLSAKSTKRWKMFPKMIKNILSQFEIIIAQSEEAKERLQTLGAQNVHYFGNLKYAAASLSAPREMMADLWNIVGDRPVWVAASTHPGEESMILQAHHLLSRHFPSILTIIIPRHPIRGNEITALATQQTTSIAQRSKGAFPEAEIEIYIADTLGELGLFYRIAPVVFIGGSLFQFGGHNPIEAAQLDCAVLHGPDMENFKSMRDALIHSGASVCVKTPSEIADEVSFLFKNPGELRKRQALGYDLSTQHNDTAIRVIEGIEKILTPA
ncbi:MAG: glycosyltransferase N-terminal domain-containing protein, partial [Pseudomonadota bacterium]